MSFHKNSYENVTDNTYQSIPSYPSYNNDRQSRKNPPQRPASFNQINHKPSNFRPSSSNERRMGLTKLNEFRNRVSEAIEMCRKQNTEVGGQFSEVVGQEKKIYSLLLDNPSILQRTASYPDIPQSHQGTVKSQSYGIGSQRPDQLKTPFQPKTIQHISQLNQFIPQYSQVGPQEPIYSPPSSAQHKASRKPSGNIYQQDYNQNQNQPVMTFGSNQPSVENLKHSLNKIKSAKDLNLNENALKMIEEIQRKAFQEIQKLRREKLQLMQRLNLEIKNVNDQKKRNAQLSRLLTVYTNQAQRPDGSYASNENIKPLQTRIQQLSSELQRANELNHNLHLQMNQKGSGVPGIEDLLRQGETIRQQTLRLIKLKEMGDSNQRVQQLERRLAAEQSQKEAALNELKILKEKPQSASRNRPFQQVQSYQRSVKVTTPLEKGATQYEDLVSEMKRITGF